MSDLFRQLTLAAQLDFVLDRLKVARVVKSDAELNQTRRVLQVYQNHGYAIKNYRPRVYPYRITLFRSSEVDINSEYYLHLKDHPAFTDPAMGWEPLSREPIEVHRVPGDHFGMVLEPHVRILAQRLRECMEKKAEVFC